MRPQSSLLLLVPLAFLGYSGQHTFHFVTLERGLAKMQNEKKDNCLKSSAQSKMKDRKFTSSLNEDNIL